MAARRANRFDTVGTFLAVLSWPLELLVPIINLPIWGDSVNFTVIEPPQYMLGSIAAESHIEAWRGA
jgi:hypothetical protein